MSFPKECQAASSFVSCVQLCLRNCPLCRSFNYGEEEGKKLCELNDEAVQDGETGFTTLTSKPEFSFAQLLHLETYSESCEEIKLTDPVAKSGVYQIYPVPNADPVECYKRCHEIQHYIPGTVSGPYRIYPMSNAEPIEVYCELDIEGGGFSFLPHNLTLRSDAQQIGDALFQDKRNVLLKLKKMIDSSDSYTLIQPHPHYTDIDFGVLANSCSGYTQPKNEFMKEYIFLGILPNLVANKKTYQGFRSNGIKLQFKNCDGNPNSYFAFFPNRYNQPPHGHHSGTSVYENSGLAANWRSHAKPVTSGGLKMPNKFFFMTELHLGGCGCYTSSDRLKQFGYNATAFGIR
ncbi:hypothetical protein AWC38_SpisGene23828 [Stylophora pistillata]|uniref:Apple domain-containing protein n=1 Tax=Stylophora pistillata TaxID=50429 RepID=A0A2B4R7J5_STYPI|nr:hypothetical protein AWC38_SpisGene23828 [Stylophora pistillata]